MKYSDGREVRVGDKVRLGSHEGGTVVCSIDRNEYVAEHPKEKWSYLGSGVVVEFPKYGVIHYEEPEDDLQLIKRSSLGGDAC